jgi:hypothetical protein
MQDTLLPTEQAELSSAAAKVVESERVLRADRRGGIKWGFLPAVAIAIAVFVELADPGSSRAARMLLGMVSFLAVGAWVEVLFLRKRLTAVEALVQLREVRARIAGDV